MAAKQGRNALFCVPNRTKCALLVSVTNAAGHKTALEVSLAPGARQPLSDGGPVPPSAAPSVPRCALVPCAATHTVPCHGASAGGARISPPATPAGAVGSPVTALKNHTLPPQATATCLLSMHSM
jgi:hypothetical protein